MRGIFILIIVSIMMACNLSTGHQSTPPGYSTEAWERIRRNNPDKAQAIEWIERDNTRSKIRNIYLSTWDDHKDLGDAILIRAAEMEMIQGQRDAFKRAILNVLEAKVQRGNASPTDLEALKMIDSL